MFPMYKYMLNKYAKSYSTWIITALSMILVIIVGGVVPFYIVKITDAESYARTIVIMMASLTSFLCLFSSVFAGFKASTMFRDEMDDGTLLVMLSKPLSRSKIFLFKWLALQSISMIYSLIIVLTFIFTMLAVDKTDVAASELKAFGVKRISSTAIIPTASLMWIVITVVGMIFSSIALLLSSRWSVGSTIGTSIAIGVIIPSTALIQLFSGDSAYKLANTIDDQNRQFISEKQMGDFAFDSNLPNLIDNPATMYNLGLTTGNTDAFSWLQAFDVDYQMKKMSELASEQTVPQETRNLVDFDKYKWQFKDGTTVLDQKYAHLWKNANKLEVITDMIKSSWEVTQSYRNELLADIFAKLATINVAKEFHNGSWSFRYQDVATGKTMTQKIDDTSKNIFNVDVIKPHLQDKATNFVDLFQASHPSNDVLLNKLFGYLFDYRNQIENLSGDEYGSAWWMINQISYNIYLESFWARIHDQEISPELQTILDEVHSYISLGGPLSLWLSQTKLRDNRLKQGYELDVEWSDVLFGRKMTGDTKIPKLDYMSGIVSFRSTDTLIFYELVSAVDAGYSLNKVMKVEYSSKYSFLIIYLVIALILVPLSFFLVQRKDIR